MNSGKRLAVLSSFIPAFLILAQFLLLPLAVAQEKTQVRIRRRILPKQTGLTRGMVITELGKD